MARRGRCRCGKVLTFRHGSDGFKRRCSRCGAVVRLSEGAAVPPIGKPMIPGWTYAPTEQFTRCQFNDDTGGSRREETSDAPGVRVELPTDGRLAGAPAYVELEAVSLPPSRVPGGLLVLVAGLMVIAMGVAIYLLIPYLDAIFPD